MLLHWPMHFSADFLYLHLADEQPFLQPHVTNYKQVSGIAGFVIRIGSSVLPTRWCQPIVDTSGRFGSFLSALSHIKAW